MSTTPDVLMDSNERAVVRRPRDRREERKRLPAAVEFCTKGVKTGVERGVGVRCDVSEI
jgi:hypothetical protein